MPNKKSDKQFIIGIIILIAWVLFLSIPVYLLSKISLDDPNLKDKYTLILNTAAGISALFSTALGFVLGHFYGKQGFEIAQERAEQAIKGKIQAEVVAEQETVGMVDKYEKIIEQNKLIEQHYMNEINKLREELIKLLEKPE